MDKLASLELTMTELNHDVGDTYHVTGINADGIRISKSYANPFVAMRQKVWRGSLWRYRTGKRKLLKRVN